MTDDRFQLIKKPSELIQLKEKVNGHSVFLYRDDPTDFAFGGNKVRFFEYLIPEILKEKPDMLLTTGSPYSNHVRVTAEVARLLGLSCEILLTEDRVPENLTGNLKLSEEAGAVINPVGTFAVLIKAAERKEELEKTGKKVFLVPNGGHTPGALRAYAGVSSSLLEALEKAKVKPKYIFLPCASGTTQAGLLCGAAKRKLPEVISFTVANTAKRAEKEMTRFIKSGSEYFPGFQFNEAINIRDIDKNDYGCPDEDLLALRRKIYREDNVLLDPTYNINAFYGMTEFLNNDGSPEDVVYLNTGGYLGDEPL